MSADATVTIASLRERFAPVFARIAEGAVRRERERILPREQIGWLRDAGFAAVRVPAALGGSGATLVQLFELLIDLAAADSNIPQSLRVHFRFVEDKLGAPDAPDSAEWLRRVAGGTLIGGAHSETGDSVRGTVGTTVRRQDGKLLLSGTKYYSTGSLYADVIAVAALDENGERVTVTIPADRPGVERVDDWAGFGQRLTASGTTVFTDVEVRPAEVAPIIDGTARTSATAFLQLVQLAGLAGIARRAADDVADFVRRRRRTYGHGQADLAARDPLIQQVVGRVDAAAFAARATVLAAAASLEKAAAAGPAGASEETGAAAATGASAGDVTGGPARAPGRIGDVFSAAEADVYRAQSAVIDLVLRATTELFEVGGASATDQSLALDRHWRNARTLAQHNPLIYKQQMVGDYLLNGTAPETSRWAGIAPSLLNGGTSAENRSTAVACISRPASTAPAGWANRGPGRVRDGTGSATTGTMCGALSWRTTARWTRSLCPITQRCRRTTGRGRCTASTRLCCSRPWRQVMRGSSSAPGPCASFFGRMRTTE